MSYGFLFRLETADGAPAEPSTHLSAVSVRPGDEIPLGYKTLRVVERRDDAADQSPVLVVEEMT